MYLKEAQRTPKVLESTGLHFDSIRTHNRCTARRVASGPCRPADRGEPGPKLDLTPKPTNSPTFVHSLYISGVQVYLMFKRLQKSGFVSLGASRAPNRSLDAARPVLTSSCPGCWASPRTDSASWPEFADYLRHKIHNKVLPTARQQICNLCFGRTCHGATRKGREQVSV